jgi:hypothetical protein
VEPVISKTVISNQKRSFDFIPFHSCSLLITDH